MPNERKLFIQNHQGFKTSRWVSQKYPISSKQAVEATKIKSIALVISNCIIIECRVRCQAISILNVLFLRARFARLSDWKLYFKIVAINCYYDQRYVVSSNFILHKAHQCKQFVVFRNAKIGKAPFWRKVPRQKKSDQDNLERGLDKDIGDFENSIFLIHFSLNRNWFLLRLFQCTR